MSVILRKYLQQKHQSQGQCYPQVKRYFAEKIFAELLFKLLSLNHYKKVQVIKFLPGHRLAHQYSITFLGLINFELEIVSKKQFIIYSCIKIEKVPSQYFMW